ncbi:MAG: DUF1080 domain-containing protein [Verrucomicrobiota bacterium]|jgi:hypothetical protein|nr:DUF1080 domain-containing protein [Verrucomicrobiota bacterium]MDD8046328.1 DUF1080 domain-containing protein [Verrucomicrobiota bacterium]MDI9384801.1 DUF1080 domain-containing protein [Verrucomicrobiota bacterium]
MKISKHLWGAHTLGAILFATALSCTLAYAEEKPATAKGEWRSLFNGKDLEGWKVKIRGYDLGENFGNTFRVEDGLLTVGYDAYEKFDDRFGHIFYEKPFSHYMFRCEYRFIGDQAPGGAGWALRNSGVMLHCQPPETMTKDQSFPVSLEVQLLGGNGKDPRPTGNICSPGTNFVQDGKLVTAHCNNSTSKTYHGDQWVSILLEVYGNDVIKVVMEDEVVFQLEKPQLDPNDGDAKPLIKDDNLMLNGGFISLQSESHPVQFRKIEILELAP